MRAKEDLTVIQCVCLYGFALFLILRFMDSLGILIALSAWCACCGFIIGWFKNEMYGGKK